MKKLAAALLLCLCACDCLNARAHYGTSLYVVVLFEGISADQLLLTLSNESGSLTLPETPNGPLDPRQTMRVQLDDSLAGKEVTVKVFGVNGGVIVARGENTAIVQKGVETDVVVELAAVLANDDGGVVSDAGPPCDPSSCAGCCMGSVCVETPTVVACGAPGSTCQACNAPDTAPVADGCHQGVCKCGGQLACADGQHCVNGNCRCDATSCPKGCCDAMDTCHDHAADACGQAGSACVNCLSTARGDGCTADGHCQCGPGGECRQGQRCKPSGGTAACVCDSASFCNGCCQGAACILTNGLASCGRGAGASCMSCPVDRANFCDPTVGCVCGTTGGVCGPGTRCDMGTCKCDATSCADGCCSAGTCVTSQLPTACGKGGIDCANCGASQCTGGACASCGVMSCTDGCCSGLACNDAGFPACGGGGLACNFCDSRADRCDGGSCVCGALNGTCGQGQFCDGGACQCDSRTCAGCCQGTQCVTGGSTTACGTGGTACTSCLPPRSNACMGGVCQCGTGAACPVGLRCATDGTCKCDETSGCTGCCTNPFTCVMAAQRNLASCGADVALNCVGCDLQKANVCDAGTCRCGNNPPCGFGLACINGNCECGPGSCNGCCQGNVCKPPNLITNLLCGGGGGPCLDCGANANCSGGLCSCGGRTCTGICLLGGVCIP